MLPQVILPPQKAGKRVDLRNIRDMDYRNLERCRRCGGKCCRIYALENRPRKLDLQEWADRFHAHRESYGIKPRFDPVEVLQPGNESLWEALRDQGIDPHTCEYLGPEGCLIPWATRPSQCRKFYCQQDEDWEKIPGNYSP